MAEYDLVVRNGTVVDGSGREGMRGDVGVRGGRIVEIGKLGGSGATEIDATDRVVSPGFVDCHTHYDVQLFFDRSLACSPWHGITTHMMGNCGFGIAPTRAEHREWILRTLQHVEGMDYESTSKAMGGDWGWETFPEFLDTIERRGFAINTAALVGHTALKSFVVGTEASERNATDAEHEQMCALAIEAIKAGAIGFSTSQSEAHTGEGGLPVPSRVVTPEQLFDLCVTPAKAGAGLFQLGNGGLMTYAMFDRVARALKGHPVLGRGIFVRSTGEYIERIAEHQQWHDEGLSTYGQMNPLPMQFEASLLDPFFPFVDMPPNLMVAEVKDATGREIPNLAAESCGVLLAPVLKVNGNDNRWAALNAPGFQESFREATSRTNWNEQVWTKFTFSEVPRHSELEQRFVLDVAAERGVHPLDLLYELQAECYPAEVRFNVGFYNFDEDEVSRALQFPLTIFGNGDAGAHARQICDMRYPTYFLKKYVRERGDFTIEHAVRKLSYDCAQALGLRDRGLLATGNWADIVVFDPATVADGPLERKFDWPAGGAHLVSEGIGMEHVIVNGKPIRAFGADVLDPEGPLPGALIRNAAR